MGHPCTRDIPVSHYHENMVSTLTYTCVLPLQVNACLLQAVVPKLTEDGKIKTVEKKPVAQIVVSEYCEEKELYFFPGFVQKAIEK